MEVPIAFELVAINDVAPIETCAYLLEYESIYGPVMATIVHSKCALILNGHLVRFTQQHDLASVDMSDVDVLFECTGKGSDLQFATAFICILIFISEVKFVNKFGALI